MDDPFSFDNENYELNVNALLNEEKVYQLEDKKYQEILEDLNNLLPEPNEQIEWK